MNRNWGTFIYTDKIEEDLYINLKEGNLVGASDGSGLDGRMAHAFCFAKKDTLEIICSGAAPVDYPEQNATSYRAEESGALALVTILERLSEKYDINGYTVPFYIDYQNYAGKIVSLNVKCFEG